MVPDRPKRYLCSFDFAIMAFAYADDAAGGVASYPYHHDQFKIDSCSRLSNKREQLFLLGKLGHHQAEVKAILRPSA